MTIIEALTEIKKRLESIEVKVSDMEKTGLPVLMAIKDICAVIDALSKPQQEEEKHEDAADQTEEL